MKTNLLPALLSASLLFGFVDSINAEIPGEEHRQVVLSDQVLPSASLNPLIDIRIFDPEFYRKFNPLLGLATDAAAIEQWTGPNVNHCLRASFIFSAADYIDRYPDLGLGGTTGACDHAIRQFVTYGFNQGRIGAFEAYPIVFDINYYLDPANNADLNEFYDNGTWDAQDVQIHWLQHGINARRAASAFFQIKDYQARYPDAAALSPVQALREYVTRGQVERRLGRLRWAEPSDWAALVAGSQEGVVPAASNDLVRRFQGANGKQTTATVKSPTWFTSPDAPVPVGIHVCNVPPPKGYDDWQALTTYLTPSGVKAGCDVVRLAPKSVYHLVLPQNQPPATDYVLNHLPYLQINNVQDFVFDGNGSTVYFTGPTLGIDINNSQRVVIENLTLDWGRSLDPKPLWRGPLFAAIGTIIPDAANSAHIVLDADTPIPPEFEPYIYAFNLWDRDKSQVASDDYLNTGPGDQGCDIYCIDSQGQQNPSQQSMVIHSGSLYPNSTPSGQWVSSQLVTYPNRSVLVRFQQFAAMAIQDDYGSSDIRIIRTTLHTSPYMGITAGQGGRGLALEDVMETPSQGRPISTVADGAHFTGVGGDIIIERGEFTHEGDDVMNMTVVWDTLTAVNSADSFVMSGPDATPNIGDILAFFDETLGFLGSSAVTAVGPSDLPPSGGQPISITLGAPPVDLRSGLHAVNLMHVPSRVFVSGVNIHDKLGRGILIGGFHVMIEHSSFRNITASAIASIMSNFFSEGIGASDIAIRENSFIHTNTVPKLYQASLDGTSSYPSRNASIAMFEDDFSNFNGVSDEVTGIYPAFQDLDISGNTFDSAAGAGIYLTGIRNVRIDENLFVDCGPVPDADPVYSYYGAESLSALVLSFADRVTGDHDMTGLERSCLGRADSSSTKSVLVGR